MSEWCQSGVFAHQKHAYGWHPPNPTNSHVVVAVHVSSTGDESEEEEEEENDGLVDGGGLQVLLGADADVDDDILDGGSEGGQGEGDEGEDFDLEDGMTLEDALADMYEEAMAAGVDPDELDIELSGEEEDDFDGDDDDEADLLDALGEESSEYETDEEAG